MKEMAIRLHALAGTDNKSFNLELPWNIFALVLAFMEVLDTGFNTRLKIDFKGLPERKFFFT